MRTAAVSLHPGQIVSHYRLVEKIGQGGMGIVFRAYNLRLENEVALKFLPEHTLADEDTRRRFAKEAHSLSRLSHPNIAIVHDFDRADCMDFLVMEYIPGTTLAEKIHARPLPEGEALLLAQQLVEGMESAHSQGVVHRDLKPSNLRVTPEGRLKILDFGLAKFVHLGENEPTESVTDRHPGTPPYMAPEQFEGKADVRTDVYGVGTVLYEMVTGKRPFPSRSAPQLLHAILHEAPDTPRSLNRNVSPEFERLILKAIDKDPDRRYQTMRELRVDLQRILAPTLPLAPPKRRWKRWLWAGAALPVLAVALVRLWPPRPEPLPSGNPVLIPLSSTAEEWRGSRLSPDGKWVSFVAAREQRLGLWLQRTDAAAEPVFCLAGDIMSHVWSESGDKLALVVSGVDRVYLQTVPVFGSTPERSVELDPSFRNASVSRWIANHVYLSVPRSGLWRHDLSTGQTEKLLDVRGPGGERRSRFAVCPAADHVAFECKTAGWVQLYLSDVSGRDVVCLTEPGSNNVFPLWLGPTCQQLVFCSDRGGQLDLWRVVLRQRRLQQVTFSSDAEYIRDASRDGSMLLYEQHEQRSNLWWMDPRAGTGKVEPLTNDSDLDHWPSAARAGKLIAFQRRKPMFEGTDYHVAQILVAERDSLRLRHLRLLAAEGGGARLSADGRWLAFVRFVPGQGWELWLADVASGHSWRASTDFRPASAWSFPQEWMGPNLVWDADGAYLYFVCRVPGRHEIRRLAVSLGAAHAEPLVSVADSLEAGDLHLSPDGRWLAYVLSSTTARPAHALHLRSLRSAEDRPLHEWPPGTANSLRCRGWRTAQDVLVLQGTLNTDLTTRIQVLQLPVAPGAAPEAKVLGTMDAVIVATARFDPVADALYFTKVDAENLQNLYVLHLRGGGARRLTENRLAGRTFSAPEFLPDGTFLYTQQENSVSSWLIRFENEDRNASSRRKT